VNNGNGAKSDKTTTLECYRAIVCTKAICDSQTGLITYFEVQDGLGLSKDIFGKTVPLQGHFNIVGKGDYDIRVVWLSEDGHTTQPAGDAVDRISLKGRDRFGAPALRLPLASGVWSLTLAWRHAGEAEWHNALGRCPVVFEVAKATQPASARA